MSDKLAAALHTGEARPTVVWAGPKPHEAWRCYVGGVLKVRQLNSGVVQVAGLDDEWRDL